MHVITGSAINSRTPDDFAGFFPGIPSERHDREVALPSQMEIFYRLLNVLLTTGNSLAYQQNLRGRKIAIVVLSRNVGRRDLARLWY